MSMFERRHYQLIADVLKANRHDQWPEGPVWREICIQLADAFASDNPRFQRDKFLNACCK